MRTGEIKALSGLRIVAAVWVVLFHFRPLLAEAAPGFRSALAPVLDCGAQGVDLFFILSGFVLTWNYLDRMGDSWSWRSTLHFLWLRLSRVWPVYLVTMHLAAVWIIFTLNVGHVPSEAADQLTAMNYVRQFLLVQLWFQPYFDGSSWDGPAWSISAEWLAYLLFGALVLVIFRIARATRARGLIYLAVAASLPPVLLLMATGLFYTPWSWLLRIVMQFTAGALVCAAVRKLQPTDRARRRAGYLSLLLAAAIVGILYLLDAHPVPTISDSAGLVDVLFVPLVLTLAMGIGTLAGAAVPSPGGVSRTHLLQPLHGSRTGAHDVELDGDAVRPSPGARPRGEGDARRPARRRIGGRGGALPRRRGAGPPMDAQHDETAPRLARGLRCTASCNRSTGGKTSGARWFRPVRDEFARRRPAFGQMST